MTQGSCTSTRATLLLGTIAIMITFKGPIDQLPFLLLPTRKFAFDNSKDSAPGDGTIPIESSFRAPSLTVFGPNHQELRASVHPFPIAVKGSTNNYELSVPKVLV